MRTLIFIIGFLAYVCGLFMMETLFVKKLAKSCGPQRLDIGWIEKTMVACAISCVNRYTIGCYSFMYNDDTMLCTPGGRLSPFNQSPTELEGDLYVLTSDDVYDGFKNYSYNNTTYNLAHYQYDVNYTQAIQACQCLNSNLYTAKTLDKWRIFISLVVGVSHDAWIGMDDLDTEGVFVWLDGEKFDWALKPTYFQGDQPDNYKNEDCVEIHWYNQLLNDEQCSLSFHFVCEKPI